MPRTLQQRMNDASASPSMIPPEATPAPPPKEEPVLPQLNTLIADKRDYLLLKRLIEEDLPWKAQASQAAKERKSIEDKIKKLLGKHQVGLALMDDIRINYYSGERESLDKGLLLAQGVSPAQIIAATKKKPIYTLKITRGKEEEDEG